ncbi:carbohydrate ABC transporter permease [Salinicoccus sp. RF5]|uniref:carbohydrate ABC transporter permease n=1 Tax=Salinicoccus sp. RF5 TaxID=2748874 RepID=UPI001E2C8A4E|nr:sugar ABC transporter permease [Salinicoccus sp. RF5]MCC4722330.1 sugar ABC transporter permease [Salinicoccus sp. RF5]
MKKDDNKFTSSLFILPYLIMFIIFLIVPLGYGFYISLHDWSLVGGKGEFVGLANYTEILFSGNSSSNIFMNGLINTLIFVVLSVPALVILALILALLLNSLPEKLQPFFRTVYFIPYSISVSIIAVIWLWMLDTNSGFINEFLGQFGIGPLPWLTDTNYAWFSLVLATVWWTVGFNMIILINALNEVSEELYEAGSIDGASPWQKFIHITLPSIRPIMLFVVVTTTIASFNVYGQPYLMTRGGPGTSTEVLLMGIVRQAFELRDIGLASAMAVIMTLIIISISAVQFKFLRNKEGV